MELQAVTTEARRLARQSAGHYNAVANGTVTGQQPEYRLGASAVLPDPTGSQGALSPAGDTRSTRGQHKAQRRVLLLMSAKQRLNYFRRSMHNDAAASATATAAAAPPVAATQAPPAAAITDSKLAQVSSTRSLSRVCVCSVTIAAFFVYDRHAKPWDCSSCAL